MSPIAGVVVSFAISVATSFVLLRIGRRRFYEAGYRAGIEFGSRAIAVRLIPLFKAYNISPTEVKIAVNTPVEIIEEPPLKNPN